MFCYEMCEIVQSNYFAEHLRTVASEDLCEALIFQKVAKINKK